MSWFERLLKKQAKEGVFIDFGPALRWLFKPVYEWLDRKISKR